MDLIVFYGTLMLITTRDTLGIVGKLEFISACTFKAELYAYKNGYPFILKGDSTVFGELYRIIDKTAWNKINEYENYDESDILNSLYIPQKVKLDNSDVEAWVYYWNKPLRDEIQITSGSWIEHSNKALMNETK